jgi:hypothetical protein
MQSTFRKVSPIPGAVRLPRASKRVAVNPASRVALRTTIDTNMAAPPRRPEKMARVLWEAKVRAFVSLKRAPQTRRPRNEPQIETAFAAALTTVIDRQNQAARAVAFRNFCYEVRCVGP